MTIGLGDVLRIACRMNHAAIGDFVNVYHYKVSIIGTSTEQDIIDYVLGALDTMYLGLAPWMQDNVNFEDINVFNVTQQSPVGTFPWPVCQYGSGGGGDMLPSQVTAFLRATTGYSRNWAKKFLGPFVESASTGNGVVASGLMTALGVFGGLWIIPVSVPGGAQLDPVVRHAKMAVWRVITDIVVRNVWATFRTRKPGRGS